MMVLKLDTDAVQLLFPEGTEARVKLQDAVIDNVVRRLMTKDYTVLGERFQGEIRAQISKHLSTQGATFNFAGEVKLKDTLVQALSQRVNEAVQQVVDNHVEAARQALLAEVGARLNDHLERGLERKVDTLVRASLGRLAGA